MNIKEALLQEHSKKQSLAIATFVGNNKKRFAELMSLVLSRDTLLSQRASWPAYTCCEKYPALILPFIEKLLLNLGNPVHDAVKRNTTGILQNIIIPEEFLGIATDVCFKLLLSKDEAIAVKANAMTVLSNIAKVEPGLVPEVRLVIQEMMPYGKPAIVARGKRVLKELSSY